MTKVNLVLTSDFPLTASPTVVDSIRRTAAHPRIAWVPPFTIEGRKRFPAAREQFKLHGISNLEFCDIDEEPSEEQLAHLVEYDVIYLTGGDPIGFRRNILRSGFAMRLRECISAGLLIVSASGGSMQLTRNVSLFRLQTESLEDVVAQRAEFEGLAVVDYEVLPHLNWFESPFLETVRRYSERVDCDIIALPDGAALLYSESDGYKCVGAAARYRKGVLTSIESAD